MSEPVVWQGFTRSALDAAYNNMAAVKDSASHLESWSKRSEALRRRQPRELDLAYGPLPRNRIDLFRCGRPGAPLLVFIHGGWWQRNSKEVFACMAEGPLAAKMDVALVGYTLAPDASLTAIVAEVEAALDCLAARGAAAACVLSGWSAGGHLTAAVMHHPFVAAGLSISGVFDLEPIRQCYINDKLGLNAAEAAALSPIRRKLTGKPLAVAYGTRELPELQRQSVAFGQHMAREGAAPMMRPQHGYDHFSILDELSQPGGALAALALELAGASLSEQPRRQDRTQLI